MRLSNKVLAVLSISAAGIALASASANAAGFYIQEQSVSGLGSAFAGSVTNIDDPSTVYFNPAGMTKVRGIQAQAAGHLLLPSSDLTDTGSTAPAGAPAIGTDDGGNPYSPSPVPNGFYTHQVNDQFWFGLGVTAPFGLANEYNDNWFGRYDSIETELLTLDIQPTVAFKINDKLSVGGGVNIQYADAKLTNAAYFGGGLEGVSELEGDDWSYGYTLGLQYKPFESTTLGLSYRSAVSHTLEGSVSAEGTAADFDVGGQADLNLPDVATIGIAHNVTDKLTLMGQATWFGWNNFEDIDAEVDSGSDPAAVVQNYQTTWAFAVGAEYDYSDAWTFRGGMQFDQTPTTDEYRTTRTPDGDRTWLSGGATYSLNDKIDIDLAATYIWVEDEEINLTRNTAVPVLASTVSADTEGNVGILAVGFTYKF
jgi:long-chain fatty acid transport protein